ncbi:hypothetical protein BpHYR1_008625 [Brachionus plicatilis]|uniref:Ig-like domain-containing protein n=1 Tax=Brachionus plicatilis TaxID=10195 RepID=A0A3M7S9J2_BRAPC|nr:hypothetical protein BpHYR1_008625 [Brachionus plicatilis]
MVGLFCVFDLLVNILLVEIRGSKNIKNNRWFYCEKSYICVKDTSTEIYINWRKEGYCGESEINLEKNTSKKTGSISCNTLVVSNPTQFICNISFDIYRCISNQKKQTFYELACQVCVFSYLFSRNAFDLVKNCQVELEIT